MSKKIKTSQLYEAVRKNVSEPEPSELDKLTVSKRLRASASREGDSEMGILLFIGVADQFGIPVDDIMNELSIELEEYKFKSKRFQIQIKKDRRLQNKVLLIYNYLRLVHGVR
jgi:hypothetical protein